MRYGYKEIAAMRPMSAISPVSRVGIGEAIDLTLSIASPFCYNVCKIGFDDLFFVRQVNEKLRRKSP